MAKQPESRLQQRIRAALEAAFPGSWLFKVHGGPFQPAGVPDLVGTVEGLFIGLEVKMPDGTVSPIQARTIEMIRAAGGIAEVVTSVEEAIAAVKGVEPFKAKQPKATGTKSHELYSMWRQMRRRCEDPRATGYSRYGGRGVTLYGPWSIRHNSIGFWKFVAFVEKELGSRPEGHELDRIDNDGPYAPGNIQWLTHSANMSKLKK